MLRLNLKITVPQLEKCDLMRYSRILKINYILFEIPSKQNLDAHELNFSLIPVLLSI